MTDSEEAQRPATQAELVFQVDRLDGRMTEEVDRLDRRIEMVVGASEDRLIGRIAGGMAEMESRLIRRMDTGFEEQARAMTHMESRLDARMDRMDVAIQEIRVNLARLATAIDGIIPRNTVK